MGNSTDRLELYTTNMQTDGNDTFDFDRDLNQNFNKIDSRVGLIIYNSTSKFSLGDWVLGELDGEQKIFKSLVNNNIGNSLSDTDYWQEVSLSGGALPIGSYITVNCTSSYVPEGCLPCDGTEYTKAQFNDLWSNYLTGDSPKLLTCSYTEYNNDIIAYGQCNKFAVDTVNNKFKVPTIKNGAYITQALSDTELGKSYNESLPNIKGAIDNTQGTIGLTACAATEGSYSGALLGSYFSGRRYSNEASSNAAKKIEFNASLSSSTYQDNAKVQGDNVRARIFVVVANGSINQSQMDWSQWASDLQGKLNNDVSTNISTTGKAYISKLGFPSNRYIDLTLGASGSTYTAPANGYYAFAKAAGGNSQYCNLENTTCGLGKEIRVPSASHWVTNYIPCKKNDVITCRYTLSGSLGYFKFIYAEGEE